MRYELVNEDYGDCGMGVTLRDMECVVVDMMDDNGVELEERSDGIYEVWSGDLVAKIVVG